MDRSVESTQNRDKSKTQKLLTNAFVKLADLSKNEQMLNKFATIDVFHSCAYSTRGRMTEPNA